MQDTVFSKTLKIEKGKLLRTVDNIEETEKIIEIINKKNLFGNSIVKTKIYSKEEKLVEHEILKYIVHSGEYTESMGYDVQKTAIDWCLDFLENGAFSWDLLPHNYTYNRGTWYLYDFGAFELNPKNVITEMRGFFKITFSNYEILRLLTRKEMSYYYLTRIRIEDIIKLIPFHRWLFLSINMTICQLLLFFKQYKSMYKYLKLLFTNYTKNYKKNYYKYNLQKEDEYLFNEINKIAKDKTSVFCIGEKAGKWAIYNEEQNYNINKFVYIDDYKLCDEYYNLIYSKNYKNISTGIIYPLVDDSEITETNYRALFDSYAQNRFYSDIVISLEFDKVEVLSKFCSNTLIIKSDKNIKIELEKEFKNVEQKDNLYIATNKINIQHPQPTKKYKDGNRGPDAHRQTWEILKLIKEKYKK